MLLSPAAERTSLHCTNDPAQDGAVRLSPFAPRGLEAKIRGNTRGCMYVHALSWLPLLKEMSASYMDS